MDRYDPLFEVELQMAMRTGPKLITEGVIKFWYDVLIKFSSAYAG